MSRRLDREARGWAGEGWGSRKMIDSAGKCEWAPQRPKLASVQYVLT